MMRAHFTLLLCACISVGALRATTVSGIVKSATGKPFTIGHVHFADASGRPLSSTDVKEDGAFRFDTKIMGAVYLTFTAVDHRPVSQRILLYGQARITVNATLATNVNTRVIDSVSVTGDFNGFADVIPMHRQADGTFSIELAYARPRLRYQVRMVPHGWSTTETSSMHIVNGTQQDRVEYDSGGDYRSVLTVEGGKATIVFRPSALPVSDARLSSATITSHADSAYSAYMHATDSIALAASAVLRSASESQYAGVRDSVIDVARRIVNEPYPQSLPLLRELRVLRSLALTRLVRVTAPDAMVALCTAYASIPPTSPVWSIDAALLEKGIAFCDDRGLDYVSRVVAYNTSYDVLPNALLTGIQLAMARHDSALHRMCFQRLNKEFPDHRCTKTARRRFSPEPSIAVGKHIPEFAFTNIDDASQSITPATLRGSYVLIDLWATWCGPCVSEVPTLEAVSERFRGRNFRILSVSLDRSVHDVAAFRRTHPMAWLHAFSPGVGSSVAADIFEAPSIPKPMLIDPEGTIVAIGQELRGESLAKTIEAYLSK